MRIDRPIRNLLSMFIALFVIVSAALIYWQVADAQQLASSPYNPRQCTQDAIPQRGNIYDRNGVLLAYSVKDNTAPCGWRRHYTDPTLSPILGYYDPTGYGITGLEAVYNDVLSGYSTPTQHLSVGQGLINTLNSVAHEPTYGNSIYLSIDDRIQQAAYNAYNQSAQCGPGYEANSQKGSIIVEDPHTGEILAMVSHPDYNADTLVDHDPAPDGRTFPDGTSMSVGDEYWQQITSDPNEPLIDRPVSDAVVPGSSFKTLTLTAALDSGQYTTQSTFTQAEATDYVVDGFDISTNNLQYYNNEPAASTFPMDIIHAFAYSDNVVFARVAVHLGRNTWLDYASRFGISYGAYTDENGVQHNGVITNVPFDLPVVHSWVFQPSVGFDNVAFANAGYGQATLQITPLVESVIVSAVAAGGAYYAPHLLLKTVPHGVAVSAVPNNAPQIVANVMSSTTAQGVAQAMRAVVTYGSVGNSGSRISDVKTSPILEGGKTGTGELDTGYPMTWWISMAPDDTTNPVTNPAKLVIIVQKENDGEGACQAPVAHVIYNQALPLVGFPLPSGS